MSFVEQFPVFDTTPSMIKPFYEDEYATIEMDKTVPCIILTLNGIPRYSEHYHFVQKKRLELMHQEIKKYSKLHMLTDSRTAGPVLDEDVAYFKNHVLPEMEQAGIRHLAIVLPASKFTRLTIKEMTQDAEIMEVRYFEEFEEAKHWLKKMTLR